MLTRRFVPFIITAALVLGAAAPLTAQQQSGGEEVAQLDAMFAEFSTLETRLQEIQAQALEDPALLEAQQELGNEIHAAMEDIDPSLPQRIERMEELEARAAAARESGDEATLLALAEEAQQIQQSFAAAQAQAMQQPEIAERVAAFQSRLQARMSEIDPEADRLIERMEELEQRLMAAMQPAQPEPR